MVVDNRKVNSKILFDSCSMPQSKLWHSLGMLRFFRVRSEFGVISNSLLVRQQACYGLLYSIWAVRI